ncbi:hypothetical protein M3223_03530 [Paenibacillus pasadenensis]|uniref:hypothetical protein n=1 Tax=Paenibacillus pasadenensis TaxID=217090 RepID=UPI00203DABF4|nr:hypothetical protein [Paenibacillus pasadenensis]MCM3746418.1 hypothetical protein [Paenibacillus pasadenensis]
MNKLRRKGTFSLLSISVLLATALAGCSSSAQENTPAASTAPSAAPVKQEGPSWTWDKTPLKIKWFVDADWYKKNWDTGINTLDKKITEETGISVEFITGNSDKFNALIASGQLPDLVTTYHGSPQRELLEKGKRVLPLNELIEKYAPDFKVPQSMQDWFRNKDGNFYGYVNYFYAPEEMTEENYYVTHNKLSMRKDLAEQLGIPREGLDTKAGMLDALRKVRDAKLEYNGQKVIPFYPLEEKGAQYFAQQFGMAWEDPQGNWLDWRKQPEALEAVKFMNQLYRENLMPLDSMLLKEEQLGSKVANGTVFAYQGQKMDQYASKMEGASEKIGYWIAGPVKGDSAKEAYLSSSGLNGWTMTMITKDSKHPDRLVRFFEYMTQPEIVLNNVHGIEGVTWDMVDGHVVKKPEVQAELDKDWAAASQKYLNGMEWFTNWVPVQRSFPLPANELQRSNGEYESKVYGPRVMDDRTFDGLIPDAGTPEVATGVKLDEYWKKMESKMVLAKDDAELESLYKEAIQYMDQHDWQKWYDIMNAKFKANKEKLGLKFAYPPLQS